MASLRRGSWAILNLVLVAVALGWWSNVLLAFVGNQLNATGSAEAKIGLTILFVAAFLTPAAWAAAGIGLVDAILLGRLLPRIKTASWTTIAYIFLLALGCLSGLGALWLLKQLYST
jgi:hypothetical protein